MKCGDTIHYKNIFIIVIIKTYMNTSQTLLITITIIIIIMALWFLYNLQISDAELQGDCFVRKRNFILVGGALLIAIVIIFATVSTFSNEKFIYTTQPTTETEEEEKENNDFDPNIIT